MNNTAHTWKGGNQMRQHNNVYLAEIKTEKGDTTLTAIMGRHFYDACRIAKSVFTSRFVRVLPLED
jgi:hypothetical protein